MESLSNDIQLFTPLAPNRETYNICLTIAEAENKEVYEALLYKIAISFGFNDCETMDLVQEVGSCSNTYCADRPNSGSLKIWLSKLMVHKCIFKISSQLFSQNSNAEKINHLPTGGGSGHKNSQTTDIPLSLRSVSILSDIIGFDEIEIAEILNTTPLQVKQRLNKVSLFINN
jgi:hypothetical protein